MLLVEDERSNEQNPGLPLRKLSFRAELVAAQMVHQATTDAARRSLWNVFPVTVNLRAPHRLWG
jgi:hypothetical protein